MIEVSSSARFLKLRILNSWRTQGLLFVLLFVVFSFPLRNGFSNTMALVLWWMCCVELRSVSWLQWRSHCSVHDIAQEHDCHDFASFAPPSIIGTQNYSFWSQPVHHESRECLAAEAFLFFVFYSFSHMYVIVVVSRINGQSSGTFERGTVTPSDTNFRELGKAFDGASDEAFHGEFDAALLKFWFLRLWKNDDSSYTTTNVSFRGGYYYSVHTRLFYEWLSSIWFLLVAKNIIDYLSNERLPIEFCDVPTTS